MLYAIMLGVYAYAISAFESVFESFGADLPIMMKLVMHYRYLLWIPLMIIIISWWPLRSKAWRNRYYMVCFLVEAILLSVILCALALPIFPMQAV